MQAPCKIQIQTSFDLETGDCLFNLYHDTINNIPNKVKVIYFSRTLCGFSDCLFLVCFRWFFSRVRAILYIYIYCGVARD